MIKRQGYLLTVLFIWLGLAAKGFAVTTLIAEKAERDIKMFCSKDSRSAATEKCNRWLSTQQKLLRSRLLTSYCDEVVLMPSRSETCRYRVMGELKYVLKTFQVEAGAE